jgi:hypothetical protein
MEPVFTIRSGYKNIKIQTQLGTSIPYNMTSNFAWRPIIFNFGINYRINTTKDV